MGGIGVPENCYLCVFRTKEPMTYVAIRQEFSSTEILYDTIVYKTESNQFEIMARAQRILFRPESVPPPCSRIHSILAADKILIILTSKGKVIFYMIHSKSSNSQDGRDQGAPSLQLELVKEMKYFRNELPRCDYLDLLGSDGVYNLNVVKQGKILKNLAFEVSLDPNEKLISLL